MHRSSPLGDGHLGQRGRLGKSLLCDGQQELFKAGLPPHGLEKDGDTGWEGDQTAGSREAAWFSGSEQSAELLP